MKIEYTDPFLQDYKKIKHAQIRQRILKQLEKLKTTPEAGKPLSRNLKGKRSLRIPPFRLIYRIKGDAVIVEAFDHRKHAYSHNPSISYSQDSNI